MQERILKVAAALCFSGIHAWYQSRDQQRRICSCKNGNLVLQRRHISRRGKNSTIGPKIAAETCITWTWSRRNLQLKLLAWICGCRTALFQVSAALCRSGCHSCYWESHRPTSASLLPQKQKSGPALCMASTAAGFHGNPSVTRRICPQRGP